jgi:hypothetical protein
VHRGRADRAEDRREDQAACERDDDARSVVAVLKELDQFDHADDQENQRQPRVVTDRPFLQLPVQDEGQNGHADQEIHTLCCRHNVKASPRRPGRPVFIVRLGR